MESTRRKENSMKQTAAENNKKLVLEAFDTLFNKRDYAAAEKFWSPRYIQHSAHIEPGREGLFDLIKSLPPTLKYEAGTIVAEGGFVIVHGRVFRFGPPGNCFGGGGGFPRWGLPVNGFGADILRMREGFLVEIGEVIKEEAPKEQSEAGK